MRTVRPYWPVDSPFAPGLRTTRVVEQKDNTIRNSWTRRNCETFYDFGRKMKPDKNEFQTGVPKKTGDWQAKHTGASNSLSNTPQTSSIMRTVPTQLTPGVGLLVVVSQLYTLCIHWSTQEQTFKLTWNVRNLCRLSYYIFPKKKVFATIFTTLW